MGLQLSGGPLRLGGPQQGGLRLLPRGSVRIDNIAAPMYIAHRGGYMVYPEESMEAYQAVAAAGYVLEVDLYPLSDGTTLVASHDATVDRTMNGTGNVSALNLAGWRALTINPKISGGARGTAVTWQDMLDAFAGKYPIAAELKGITPAQYLAATPAKFRPAIMAQTGDVTLSASAATLVAAGCPVLVITDSIAPASLVAAGVKYVGVSTSATSTYVGQCAAAGLRVIPYAVTTLAQRDTWLGYGSYGVFTDDPAHTADVWPTPGANTDPFGDKMPWSSWWTPANASQPRTAFFGSDQFGGQGGSPTGSSTGSLLKWAGKRGPRLRIVWTVNFVPATVGGNSQYGGSMFVGVSATTDATFSDAAQTGTNGYQFRIMRSGAMEIRKVTDGAQSTLAIVTTPTSPLVADQAASGSVTLQLDITSTAVALKRLDNSATITSADTTYRPTNAHIVTRNGSTDAYVNDITITDLP